MEKGGNLYMSSWLSYVILVLGFVLLTKGADYFVEGAAAAAKKMRIPTFIIGMTIVAMGTSAPECAVSVTAALKHNNELAVSNAVGSNIFNLLFILGISAVIHPVAVNGASVYDMGILLFASLLSYLFLLSAKTLKRLEGIVMFAIYIASVIFAAVR